MESYMSEYPESSKGSPLQFFALTIAISWLIWLPGVLDTFNILSLALDDSIFVFLNVAGGAIPTIMGLFLFYREEGIAKMKEVLARGVDPRRISRKWWLPILFLIPVINASALFLGILSGGPVPDLPVIQQWWLIPVLFVGGFIPISNAFREEFGWRGYAIERLQSRWGLLTTSIIIGLAWGLWHLPLRYFPGGVDVYSRIPLWVFMINTTALSIMMTWLYNNNNRSIFTAVVFHVVLNLSSSIFPFGLTDMGVYYNMIFYGAAALMIVLFSKRFGFKLQIKTQSLRNSKSTTSYV
jgi:membrane protease YdiL (CAAX protease family)